MRQRAAEIGENEVHIRFVVVIDRRVVAKPEHIGAGAGDFWIGGERKFLCSEAGGEEFVQARLEQRRLAGIQPGDVRRVEIESDDLEMPRATRGSDAAEMPEAEDGDIHRRWSTHWFCWSHCSVRTMLCSMVSVVFQPVARIFLVSRKMNGLSPTQPLFAAGIFQFGFEAERAANQADGIIDLHVFVRAEVVGFHTVFGLFGRGPIHNVQHRVQAIADVEIGFLLCAVTEDFQVTGVSEQLLVKIQARGRACSVRREWRRTGKCSPQNRSPHSRRG